jgi:hypothetical protein
VDRVCSLGGNHSHGGSTPEVRLARVAADQHGVVTQAQLIAAGLDRDAIAYRRRVGRLHLLHRGVYAVGHRPPSPLATAIAAVLACGPDAVLSHRSAAALWRIVARWHTPTEVTAPTQHRLTTPQELTTLLTRYPGRRTARLTPGRGATKSTLEDDLEFPRFRGHLTAGLSGRPERMFVDAKDAAVFEGVPG